MLIFSTSLIAYALIYKEYPQSIAYFPEWVFMVLSTLAIAAGGYWLNDLYDEPIDRINRPMRARKVAWLSRRTLVSAVVGLWLLAALLALRLPWRIFFLHIGAICALAWYARWGKKTGLPGNTVVSALTGLVVWEVLLLVRYTTYAADWMIPLAIGFNFVRELVKDAEDLVGDRLYGVRSLPTHLAPATWDRLLKGLLMGLMGLTLLPALVKGILWQSWPWTYMVTASLLVLLPLTYAIGTLPSYPRISQALKIAMAGGLIALFFL
jgi:4-hydroxybenzoate polyprenyltransferase